MKKATVILALVGLFNATAYAQQSAYWGGLLQGLAQGYAQQQRAEQEREQEKRRAIYKAALQHASSAPPDVAQQLFSALAEDTVKPQKLDKFLAKIAGIIAQQQRREREEALALQRQSQHEEAVLREISEILSQLNPEMQEQVREGLRQVLQSGRLDKNSATRAEMAQTLLESQTQALQDQIAIPQRDPRFDPRFLPDHPATTSGLRQTAEQYQPLQFAPVPEITIPRFSPERIETPDLFSGYPSSAWSGTSTTLPNRFGATTLHRWGGASGASTTIPTRTGTTTLHNLGGIFGTSTTIPNLFGSTTLHNLGGMSGTSTRIPSRTGATTFHTFQDTPGSPPVNCKSEELWGTVYTTCR